MPVQFSESAEDAMPTSRQDIRHISVTNGGMSFAGNFQNLTITNNQQDKVKNCRNQLFVSHPDIDRENLAEAKGQRTPGTCQWILNDPQYQSWLAGAFPVLRISGGPGRGKTIMSLFLAEEIEKLYQQNGDHLLSYFCQFQDDLYNDPHNVLRSLIYQLLKFSQDEPQVDEILEYFETPEKRQRALGSLDCLWKILMILLSQPSLPTVFCIIDGIDECRESEFLTSKFYGYCASIGQGSAGSKFQLVMLGRVIDGPITPHVINLDPDNDQSVSVDIKTFIEYSLEPLMAIPGFAEIRPEITKTLSTRAEGTFLWISFVIHELTRKRTCLQIQDAMKYLPKGLYPIFTRMLHAIDSGYQESSANIFRWVAFAERPFTLQELAVATVDGQDETDGRTIADRVAICRPLLTVHEDKVFFVHQSAKEYLLQIQQKPDSSLLKFRLIPDQCHDMIAHKCLNAMETDFLRRNTADDQSDDSLRACHSDRGLYGGSRVLQPTLDGFLRYAIEYWSSHARLSATQTQWLSDLNRPFLRNSSMRRFYSHGNEERLSEDPILFASYFGLASWIELLYRNTKIRGWTWTRIWRQKFNNSLPTPLECAIKGRGDEMTIRFLLEQSSNIPHTAIFDAIKFDQSTTVQLLLHHGVKTEIEHRYYFRETPLIWSVEHKRESIVCLLLDNKAKIEAKNEFGMTALMTAARYGDRAMVQLLIDRGANIKANNCIGADVLIEAAKSGESSVVQMLLDHGADIRIKDMLGMPALIEAAKHGKGDMIQILLDHGADIKAKDRMGKDALIIAAEHGKSDMIQILLDHGADIRIKDKSGMTALMHALVECHESTLKILLQFGAEINANIVAKIDRPLIYIATREKSQFVVDLLLENGACVDRRGSNQTTPLICTIMGFTSNPVFIERKSSARCGFRFFMLSSQGYWRSPVTHGAKQKDMMITLLHHGADVSLCGEVVLYDKSLLDGMHWDAGRDIGEGNGTVTLDAPPLVCAAALELDWAVRLLVEHGADCNSRAVGRHFRKAGSALVYAAQAGNLSTVQLLLSLGADTSIEDCFGMTALMWATKKGFLKMERLLKAHEEERVVSSE
ncbi:unnamed protein product [Fusarium graminearum]|nr:unnamed protein product [Fusarium graminearum]